MAKRTYPAPVSGIDGWDAELNAWLSNLQLAPLPIWEPLSGLFANLPAATQNDRGLAAVSDPTAGWILVLSDGTNYRKIGVQAATQAASGAATVAALVIDFNALLVKLKNAGLMA